MSYSRIISKQNAAILLTKIQMWRMTMSELSIIDDIKKINLQMQNRKKSGINLNVY